MTVTDRVPSTARLDGWPDEVAGNGVDVPAVGGGTMPYAYLDNAASTPPLRAVQAAIADFLPWYSSVHRGTGYKSRVATAAYEAARERVRRFVGAGDHQAVLFTKSTTESLNRVSYLVARRGTTVFTTALEHHANMLPWRLRAPDVRLVRVDANGVLDEDDLVQQLRTAPAGPKLVAIGGAYNVTGYTPAIHRLARIAHEQGAEILVDGAQLVPHRPLDLRGGGPGEEIDYLAFSAHKIYAPFGIGILVAPSAALEGAPELLGGGAVRAVSADEVVWGDLPDREEAGSPNVVGAVALGAALVRLEAIGRTQLEAQEDALATYALTRLAAVPGLRVLGPPSGPDRVGVISFIVEGLPHDLVAASLGYEHAIGVRSGRFCAHPGLDHLLDDGRSPAEGPALPLGCMGPRGAVRMSLGLQNTRAEVDRLVDALIGLVTGARPPRCQLDPRSGEFRPPDWEERYPDAVQRLLTVS